MIYVRLMGGLGNQMFQYAASRRLADAHGVPLVLDLSHLLNQPSREVPRDYELDCFHIRAALSETRIEATRFPRNLTGSKKPRLLRERGFRFQQRVLCASDESLLFGYWQSERYFKDDEDAIRADFNLRQPLSGLKQEIADQIDDSTVSLQVRRTDYVTHPASAGFSGALPEGYYRRAVEHVAREIPSPRFLVISDDPDWCRRHLNLGYPAIVVERVPGADHEDMHLMSMCRGHIVANSSFGWWGAWLATNPDKAVVAPRRWFAKPRIDTRDLIPDSWTRL